MCFDDLGKYGKAGKAAALIRSLLRENIRASRQTVSCASLCELGPLIDAMPLWRWRSLALVGMLANAAVALDIRSLCSAALKVYQVRLLARSY